jgi:ZIP family zinc transporter
LGTVLDGIPESVVLGTTLVAALGNLLMGDAAGSSVALAQAFAAGALLTMLADTMIPEAYEFGGPTTGLMTVLGFSVAFGISTLS